MKLEKLEAMKEESYERKDYLKELNMEEARTFFRLRSRYTAKILRERGPSR